MSAVKVVKADYTQHKVCPFRVHGTWYTNSDGEKEYKEYFMPCIQDACACYRKEELRCYRDNVFHELRMGEES